ncbi:MAG TPA: hypothetical protein VFC14_21300 [Burkholderiales bacterium]|nr:hypothetical protein [Burkholderiales bacterium]
MNKGLTTAGRWVLLFACGIAVAADAPLQLVKYEGTMYEIGGKRSSPFTLDLSKGTLLVDRSPAPCNRSFKVVVLEGGTKERTVLSSAEAEDVVKGCERVFELTVGADGRFTGGKMVRSPFGPQFEMKFK